MLGFISDTFYHYLYCITPMCDYTVALYNSMCVQNIKRRPNIQKTLLVAKNKTPMTGKMLRASRNNTRGDRGKVIFDFYSLVIVGHWTLRLKRLSV